MAHIDIYNSSSRYVVANRLVAAHVNQIAKVLKSSPISISFPLTFCAPSMEAGASLYCLHHRTGEVYDVYMNF